MSNSKKIDKALAYIRYQRNSGKTDLQIKRDLQAEGMDMETIQKLFSIEEGSASSGLSGVFVPVNKEASAYANQLKRAKGQRNIAIGSVALFLGVLVTVGTMARANTEGGMYVIATGPIALGIALLIGGIIQVVSSRQKH